MTARPTERRDDPGDHDLAALDDALAFLGSRLQVDAPLGPLTTYRVGGHAARLVEVADAAELGRIAAALAELDDPVEVLVVGRGSNLLVAERGVRALAVQLGDSFTAIEIDPSGTDAGGPDSGQPHPEGVDPVTTVIAGGAASLPVVARRTVAAGLTGFEWAVGVPGSIGGAIRMNAGGHGSDMAAVVSGVRVVDLASGEDVVMEAGQLEFGYRRSALRPSQVVVDARLSLRTGDPATGTETLSEIVRWRRENQPGGQNAGSVFTNPPGESAGRLIDRAGGRGLRIGSAEVSTKHANFIQVDPDGSADDVYALMRRVVELVEEHAGVVLHPETVLVGFDDADAAPPSADSTEGSGASEEPAS